MSIVKMKRLRLFALSSDREELLRKLQHLGCVEIDEPTDKLADPDWAGVARVDDTALASAKEAQSEVSAALAALKKYAPVKTPLLARRREVTEQQLFDDAVRASAQEAARALVAAEKRISALYAEQSKLKNQKASLAPWLDLDVPLETAFARDVTVIFGTISVNTSYEEMEGALAALTDLAALTRAGRDRELQYLLFLCHDSVAEEALELLKGYGFSRAALRGWTGTARENDQRLDVELARTARELEQVKAGVAEYDSRRADLVLYQERLVQEVAREEAKGRLLATQATFFLEGWVPVPEEGALAELLGQYTCAWETAVPDREEYPQVPVKLKSNTLTEPLTVITEMYSLPAYDGVDPNPLMMPFYVFFFGFMFADFAYGIILAAICAVIQFSTRPKGGFGYLVRLMLMCGIASAVIGFFTGGFFSDFLSRFTGMLGLATPQIPFLTSGPVLDVINEPMTALVFTLAVGLVQIVVGMAVKFYMLCRDGQVWDAIWDIGTWWVIFVGIGLYALDMAGVASIGIVNGIPVVLVVGCVMLLAQARTAKGLGKVTAVIGAVYNGVTGYFGDILSYSRLMVMMLASSVIGQVFNILAAMPGGGLPPVLGVPIFFVIFLVGHAFNFGLNIIGTYVHTSRLQYLEFFKQFYKEGGRPFRPLNINTTNVDIIKEEK